METRKLIYLILIIILMFPVFCLSYQWHNIGPEDVESNNFGVAGGGLVYEILCISTGLLVNTNGDWIEYSNLPVQDIESIAIGTADLLVVMGNGSYSDGVYLFNFITNEFIVSEYFPNPNFIEFCQANGYYYVGGSNGLIRSNTGTLWESVTAFNGLDCFDMAINGNYFVISTSDDVYCSDNMGESWSPSNAGVHIEDLEFGQNGTLYGIFPDSSWSSGLWSSTDNGLTWNVEFWSAMMSSVGSDFNGTLFVGWEEEFPGSEYNGIARYEPSSGTLIQLNDGLGNYNINRITTHPLIDCYNIVCCTDSGTYLLTDYSAEVFPPENVIVTEEGFLSWDHCEINRPGRLLENFNVYLNNELIAQTEEIFYQFSNLEFSVTYNAGVSAQYSEGESEIIEVEFVYTGEHLYGDVDDNEEVEALDAALILQYVVEIDPAPHAPLPWENWRIATADVDGNENVGSYDASLILQYSVGIIEQFPVEIACRIAAPTAGVSLERER